MLFTIITHGCQMNEYDTHTIQSELVAAGHQPVLHPQDAELIVLNTCAVRGKPVEKVVTLLGEFRKEKQAGRDLTVALMGCLAQLEEGQEIAEKFAVDILVGPGAITDIVPAVAAIEEGAVPEPGVQGRPAHLPAARTGRSDRLSDHHARLQPPLHLLHRPLHAGAGGVTAGRVDPR